MHEGVLSIINMKLHKKESSIESTDSGMHLVSFAFVSQDGGSMFHILTFLDSIPLVQVSEQSTLHPPTMQCSDLGFRCHSFPAHAHDGLHRYHRHHRCASLTSLHLPVGQ
jgi:hypothetical protein